MFLLFLRTCAVPALFCMLAGCQQSALIKDFEQKVPLQDQQLARHYSDLLREKQLDYVRMATEPGNNGDQIRQALPALSAAFPAGEPRYVKVVGYQRIEQRDAPQLQSVSFEYAYPEKWIVSTVVLRKYGTDATIMGLSVAPQSASLEQLAIFTLGGKSLLHYVVLGAAILSPLLILSTLVLCLRSKLTVRKWPWLLFISIGFGQLSLNWATGQYLFLPIAIQLFGVAAGTSAYQPWTFIVSLPLGASVFLLVRKKLAAPAGSARSTRR